MRVALYQINSDRDTFNTKFMNWRWRTDHDYIILPEEYDKVFDGDIQARSLAEIFVLFNVMPPEGRAILEPEFLSYQRRRRSH